MKRIISPPLLTIAFLLLAFKAPVKQEIFKVDTEKSSINWTGRKVTGQHTGSIKIASGQLLFNKTLKSGSFVIDMNSLICSDSEKVQTHLKADDFFSVEKNPTSQFVITKVAATGADRVNITGNLTIKGITQPLTFPATVKRKGNAVVAVAKGVKVNRLKYDIKFRSLTFFSTIGDKAIDDEFELDINLIAKLEPKK
ncbi:MAG TPA: YceI family protein [Sphingobacteriaceae bacterium]|nr:YceI family protein [Sphingobacteriaceae bacterium]